VVALGTGGRAATTAAVDPGLRLCHQVFRGVGSTGWLPMEPDSRLPMAETWRHQPIERLPRGGPRDVVAVRLTCTESSDQPASVPSRSVGAAGVGILRIAVCSPGASSEVEARWSPARPAWLGRCCGVAFESD
jgi:hypothetical protein